MDFYETWYKFHIIESYYIFVHFNSVPLITSTWGNWRYFT